MNDEDQIRNLIHLYALGYDERDPVRMGTYFVPEGEFSWEILGGPTGGPYTGVEAIVASNRASLDAQDDTRRHVMTNMVLGGEEGDERTASSYLTLFAHQGGGLHALTTGVYHDVVVRTEDGSWKFRSRHLVLDLPF
jgi:SnoaL-like domain